jgi:DNA-nicking Smr family endonuclease
MKKDSPREMFRPFKHLDKMLSGKTLPEKAISSARCKPAAKNGPGSTHDEEGRLFKKAMAGVVPVSHNKLGVMDPGRNRKETTLAEETLCDTLHRLEQLVNEGKGFVVADTPEYIAGVGPGVHPSVSRYLHAGRFSIQAYIDLHGLSVVKACEALDEFFKEAITSGKRAVCVVHGRGLSSPDQPVLKAMFRQWLTTGPWRKWVIAFSSARATDGGAGATYVLLRRQPLSKRYRKK